MKTKGGTFWISTWKFWISDFKWSNLKRCATGKPHQVANLQPERLTIVWWEAPSIQAFRYCWNICADAERRCSVLAARWNWQKPRSCRVWVSLSGRDFIQMQAMWNVTNKGWEAWEWCQWFWQERGTSWQSVVSSNQASNKRFCTRNWSSNKHSLVQFSWSLNEFVVFWRCVFSLHGTKARLGFVLTIAFICGLFPLAVYTSVLMSRRWASMDTIDTTIRPQDLNLILYTLV